MAEEIDAGTLEPDDAIARREHVLHHARPRPRRAHVNWTNLLIVALLMASFALFGRETPTAAAHDAVEDAPTTESSVQGQR